MNDKVIIDVKAHYYTSYALASDNTVYSWGGGGFSGFCDPISSATRKNPVAVSTSWVPVGTKIVKATIAVVNIFWQLDNGDIYGCGNNDGGQLDATKVAKPAPIKIDSQNVDKNDAWIDTFGSYTIFALTKSGNVYSWGHNAFGSAGNGNTGDVAKPTLMNYFKANGIVIKKICSYYRHTIALSTKGKAYFWGQIVDITNFSTTYSEIKTLPSGFSAAAGYSVVDISCSGESAAILLENGDIYTIGVNSSGRLGEGTYNNARTFVKAFILNQVEK
ncbi:hypothetical protein ABK040_009022 [Willaertia magna]